MTTVALALISIGGFFSALNWLCLFASLSGKRYVSPVLPAPSTLTAAGLALIEQTRPWWWAGLLTDYTLFGLLYVTPRLIAHAWHTSRFTRLRLLKADDPPRHFDLSLHRGGRFLLRATFDPSSYSGPEGGTMSFGMVGRWQAAPDGRLLLDRYAGDHLLVLEPEGPGYTSRETSTAEPHEPRHASLDGLRFLPQNRGT